MVFDNYDSFTYNLVQIVEQILAKKLDVFRNDEIPLEDINQYDKIILSPGSTGIPRRRNFIRSIKNMLQPNLFFGFVLVNKRLRKSEVSLIFRKFITELPNWSKTSKTSQNSRKFTRSFRSGTLSFLGGKSWRFPRELEITSLDDSGMIMSLKHKKPRCSQVVQYHPESILTQKEDRF